MARVRMLANKCPVMAYRTGAEIRAMRKERRLNQIEFWNQIGVAQSVGSRYEVGRDVPEPVLILLHLTYDTSGNAEKLLNWLRDLQVDD